MINYNNILPEWKKFFSEQEKMSYFSDLINQINDEYNKYQCFPNNNNIFSLFQKLPPKKIKIVILGQDPYHNLNQANGIAFSVSSGLKIPPSLFNIFQELKKDLKIDHFYSGDLTNWVKQGVFLYNTILTVRERQPLSHQKIGWLTFSKNILIYLNTFYQDIIYVLWGNYAKKFEPLILNKKNIICGAHPSPLSYHLFKDKKFFIQINDLLKKNKKNYVDWTK